MILIGFHKRVLLRASTVLCLQLLRRLSKHDLLTSMSRSKLSANLLYKELALHK